VYIEGICAMIRWVIYYSLINALMVEQGRCATAIARYKPLNSD
jgi:hypothetical protein